MISLGLIKKDFSRVWKSISTDSSEIFKDGLVKGFMGNYESAIEDFERVEYLALGSNELKKNAIFYKAAALSELEKFEESMQEYKRLLKFDPKDGSTLNNIADIYIQLEKFEEALEYAEKAIQMEWDEHDEEAGLSWETKSEALLGLEKYEEALECIEKSLTMNPDVNPMITKAEILLEMDRYQEAEEILKKIISISPEDPDVLNLVGVGYLLLDRYEQALEYYEKGLRIEPNNPTLWYNKACVLSNLNKKNEALDSLFIAISTEPEMLMSIQEEGDLENIKETDRFKEFLKIPV